MKSTHSLIKNLVVLLSEQEGLLYECDAKDEHSVYIRLDATNITELDSELIKLIHKLNNPSFKA